MLYINLCIFDFSINFHVLLLLLVILPMKFLLVNIKLLSKIFAFKLFPSLILSFINLLALIISASFSLILCLV